MLIAAISCVAARRNYLDNVRKVPEGFQCTICNTVLGTKGGAKDHYQFIHLEADFVFVCPVCAKQCSSRQYLYRHMRDVHSSSYTPKQMTAFMIPKNRF